MRADKIFWGLILILIGSLFLLENLDIIEFSFSRIWRFWPVLLIYWGVSALLKKKDGTINPLLIGIQVLILVLVVYFAVRPHRGTPSGTGWQQEHKIEFDSDDDDEKLKKYDFAEDFDSAVKTASFSMEFGAGSLELKEGDDKLVKAKAKTRFGGYAFESNVMEGNAEITMDYNGENIKLHNGESLDNTVFLELHTAPVWAIYLEMGAASVDFDLTKHKISEIEVDCGASELKLALGQPNGIKSILKLKSGVADIDIDLPADVACEIISNSALSSKDFEGFTKVSSGIYRTPDFDKSKTHWVLSLETGVSSVSVSR